MTTFKRFEADDIVKANSVEITTGLWTGNTGSLTSVYSASSQASGSSGQYYWNVYNINPSSSDAEVQFAVAYGHRTGGGSPSLSSDDNALLASQAVYSQYRNLLLSPGDSQFTFLGSYASDQIYVLNISRALLKQQMDPGNWALRLSGSNGTYTFIDDSGQSLGASTGTSGQVFNVVSGSLTGASGSTIVASSSAAAGGFGLFYPLLGLIVLNPQAIVNTVGFVSGSIVTSGSRPWSPVTASGVTTPQLNHGGLYNSIRLAGDFQARSAETISSTHYFVRLRNKDFNYSNNPTYFDETDGTLINNEFIKNPISYPTTIGLYNDANELLAIGKLSRPQKKSSETELLIKVRLDW